MKKTINGIYFEGNRVSEYGISCGYVDYRTLAKSFDAILCNDIMQQVYPDNWEVVNGNDCYYENPFTGEILTESEKDELLNELQGKLDCLDSDSEEYKDILDAISEIDDPRYKEYMQIYIISGAGYRTLEYWTNETVWYNPDMDLYVWGVTHCGTSWDYVLTDIRINKEERKAY